MRWNRLTKRKPRLGSSVLAKTQQNTVIPCIYENGEFIKIHVWAGKLERFCSVSSVVAWVYEISDRKEIGISEIALRALDILCNELKCNPEVFDFYQDSISRVFIDTMNNNKKKNKNIRCAKPVLETIANEAAIVFLKMFTQENTVEENEFLEVKEPIKECVEKPIKLSKPRDLCGAIARAIEQTNAINFERRIEQLKEEYI